MAPLKNRRPFLPRRRRLLVSALVLVVLASSAGGYVVIERNRSTVVSLDEAISSFRDRTTTRPEAEPTDRAAPTVPTGDGTGPEAPEIAAEPRSDPADVEVSAVETTEDAPYQLPAEGVYTYRASGGERISIFGASHTYPERVHATITHLEGCRWEHRNEVLAEHVDIRQMCSNTDGLFQVAQERQVEFLGQRDSVNNVCDPPQLQHAPGEEPGTRSTVTCSDGEGNEATLVRTYLGHEPTEVGGQVLDAVHIRIDATFTGKAEGSSVDLFRVSPTTGLPYRWDRTVDTVTDAGWGAQVRYEEDASFVLESLQPQR